MGANHRFRRYWPLRRFVVAEDSMRPALAPGDGIVALRGGAPRTGQLRVFPDPTVPARWLVKRVGEVTGTTFQACSDNPRAAGVEDSRHFGSVPADGSYRVIWTLRSRR
ncbi:MAG: S26 family signal peptidase [Mycobacterium sp.]